MIRRSTWRPLAGPGPRPGQTAVISAWANCGDGAGGGGGGLRRRIAVFTSAFLSLWPFGCHEPRRERLSASARFSSCRVWSDSAQYSNTAVEVT